MELHAYTKNVNEIFSLNKKYVVPRFQREYSWTKEEVGEFWEDVTACISPVRKGGKTLKNEDYFIGSLVLIGDDASFEHSIVDGQQRLTTLTILLRALTEAFNLAGEKNIGQALYNNYIEGTDNDGKSYFKLINETPKPFFQNEIQFIKPEHNSIPSSDEEKLLNETFNFFKTKLEKKSLAAAFDGIPYKEALKAIRTQTLNHLKFIYINVKKEDDAYSIFETLNARGMSLSSVDLIKNWIFKNLKRAHPYDNTKSTWKKMGESLRSRQIPVDIETFFRHHWNSKYGYSSEDRIYKSFKLLVKSKEIGDPKIFLDALSAEASTYNKICNPLETDWKGQSEKSIYSSLTAMNLFKVTQTRPFLLALVANRKNINTAHLIQILKSLEHFHFIFTAVCSSRASGLDGKYAKSAKEIRFSESKSDSKRILNDLIESLIQKLPSETVFTESFSNLWFCKEYEKDKKIIQYLFSKTEAFYQGHNELKLDEFSLEHIQDQYLDGDLMGKIGNLVPLAAKINNSIPESSTLDKKVPHYQKSALKTVSKLTKYITDNNIKEWTDEEIESRTSQIAFELYQSVMAIEKIK
ncbi:DUF262 domain-containing protein [Pseudomonas viridiflava]|uniref:DUF262 domain-containing protein n=1 Tax=Pseudomonas viridiflava TaxID=33069 RepID=UPI002EB86781|nr:DUF262 domain-containing protein [Pseudomonas viridiflava]